jgi:hypothetical protein
MSIDAPLSLGVELDVISFDEYAKAAEDVAN